MRYCARSIAGRAAASGSCPAPVGVGERPRAHAVYTDCVVMHDALDENEVARITTGEAFRQRFGNPYAVIHRVDVHLSLLEGAQETGRVGFLTRARVERVEQDDGGVTVHCSGGQSHRGQALIGADGGKSAVRAQYVGAAPRVTGHVVYRAVVDKQDLPENLRWNVASIWVGPNCHLVHCPLRGRERYNVVVTFYSRGQEEWGVTEGSKASRPRPGEDAGQPRDVPGHAVAVTRRMGAGPSPHAERGARHRGGRKRPHHGGRRKVHDEPGRPDPHAHRPVARTRA